MKTVAALPHVHLDEHGRPWLDDTNVRVIEVVLDHLGYGWGAETIQENHPQLSLAQVYAALAWYYDHQAEMDAEITKQEKRLAELRAAAAPSPLQRRLAALRRGARASASTWTVHPEVVGACSGGHLGCRSGRHLAARPGVGAGRGTAF